MTSLVLISENEFSVALKVKDNREKGKKNGFCTYKIQGTINDHLYGLSH